MGSQLHQCLLDAVSGNSSLVAFPNKSFFRFTDGKCQNLDIRVVPTAVTYPTSASQIAQIVKCATDFKLPVQARSGGHSFGNYSLGGKDGAIIVDLKNFQQFSIDSSTWCATIGAGTKLKDVAKKLYDHGRRAIAHGTCPSVGIGGHATIGGLGPTSRLWGSALDHIEEVTVVLADSTITKASASHNSDLFFALRGAAAGFGIITEFKFRTHPAPETAVVFSYTCPSGTFASMADTFKDWQRIVSTPNLSRKISTQVELSSRGMVISGSYLGSQEEFMREDLAKRFIIAGEYLDRKTANRIIPQRQTQKRANMRIIKGWLAILQHWAGGAVMSVVVAQPTHFFHKSLTVPEGNDLSTATIDALFSYLDSAKKPVIWAVILDISAGAVNDVAVTETAFANRNTLHYIQAYAAQLGKVQETTKNFLRELKKVVTHHSPQTANNIYPGYVDPELDDAQRRYWGANLERLREIKTKVDPDDVFQNPQSVRPYSFDEIMVGCSEKDMLRHGSRTEDVLVSQEENRQTNLCTKTFPSIKVVDLKESAGQ